MSRNKLYIVLLGLSLAGYVWIGWSVVAGTPNVCLFKEVTHLPCPACGTTRSLLLLMNGHFTGSLLVNPFGIFIGAGLLIVPFWIGVDVFRKRDSFHRRYMLIERTLSEKKWVFIPALAIVILNWCWNISKGL